LPNLKYQFAIDIQVSSTRGWPSPSSSRLRSDSARAGALTAISANASKATSGLERRVIGAPGESGTTVRGRIGDQGASRRMLATQRGRWHLLPMDLQLRGKRALVTGSTAGIGLAIAVDLGREGGGGFLNGRPRARGG